MSEPLISVIVPVYNQWDLVPRLIGSLEAQSLSRDRFEVLLVDNGSDRVPPADKDPGFVRRLSCATPGSYAARNHGAAQARGRWFAFTDADCRPHPDWLREIDAALSAEAPGNRIIAGAVTILPASQGNMKPAELYDTMMGIPQALYVRRGYGVTANLALAKQLFERLGGFDARRFSGGDAEFCRRAAATAGAVVDYCGKAVVFHPARDSMDTLITKARRIKGGQLTAGPLRRRALFVIRTFLPPARAWARALRNSSFAPRQRLVVCLVQSRLWLAEMAEVLRLACGKKPERR